GDRAARRVLRGVLAEIPERLLEQVSVRLDREAVLHLDVDRDAYVRLEPGCDLAEERGELDRLDARRPLPPACACQRPPRPGRRGARGGAARGGGGRAGGPAWRGVCAGKGSRAGGSSSAPACRPSTAPMIVVRGVRSSCAAFETISRSASSRRSCSVRSSTTM